MSINDDVEDENEEANEVADPVTGQIRVCAFPCPTCVFHPGNLMNLLPGRLSNMMRETARRAHNAILWSSAGRP
ncbi:hypothetical protein GCM10009753_59290 [Streptantibioticus ferralitis]